MKTIIFVLMLALIMPAIGTDDMKMFGRDGLTSDPWMNMGSHPACKPTHQIDGQTMLMAGSTGQLGDYAVPWAQQNGWVVSGDKMAPGPKATDRGQWDGYLGSVPMAGLDSLYGPGGEPALKTTDPMYLAMGARPIVDQSNLPVILRCM
jgi:hypothetical protein